MENKPRWHYFGDVNLEEGGTFYTLDEFAHAVRVTPVSDAGGQDNAWWVERGSIHIPDNLEGMLKSAGILESDLSSDPVIRMHELIHMADMGGYIEYERSEVIQIGPEDPFHGSDFVEPHVTLRANTDLRKWIKRKYLG